MSASSVIRLPLLWLDPEAGSTSGEATYTVLSNNFGRCNCQSSVGQCKTFLRTTFAETVVITSGQLGKELVSELSPQEHVSKVYIFCQNKRFHQAWSRDYPIVGDGVVRHVLFDVCSRSKASTRTWMNWSQRFALITAD